MRVIVFDRELHEPLTVVEVPHWLAERAKEGLPIKLLPPPGQVLDYDADESDVVRYTAPTIVTLRFQRVARGRENETLFWYAYADDPETALLLRAAFLPGQVGEVQRREKEAYVKGLFAF